MQCILVHSLYTLKSGAEFIDLFNVHKTRCSFCDNNTNATQNETLS